MRVKDGFWMGRTEVSVGQFRRFTEESKYVSDAEKPGGKTQCFNPKWDAYHLTTKVVHPWEPMPGKSWRDPNGKRLDSCDIPSYFRVTTQPPRRTASRPDQLTAQTLPRPAFSCNRPAAGLRCGLPHGPFGP